jgi:hypothetical protein
MMVASAVGVFVITGALMFMNFTGVSLSGITGQSIVNQQAGNTIEFIQDRARYATGASNDASGNILTFWFDDDPDTDSDLPPDGIPYNDKDHREQFQFIGVNGSTNSAATNRIIYSYLPKAGSTNQPYSLVLIPAGVRNLPGCSIFVVTNMDTTIVRFAITDGYGGDHYQSIDVQATIVPLNRPAATNLIAILP